MVIVFYLIAKKRKSANGVLSSLLYSAFSDFESLVCYCYQVDKKSNFLRWCCRWGDRDREKELSLFHDFDGLFNSDPTADIIRSYLVAH